MKKLLLLGGLRYLIPVIKTAQEMGHYVITCDYLPDNPAHQYADEYHNVSILDKKAVLELAQSLKIDGIMSFAVDPGVVPAAYVAEKMGLPAPGPLKSVEILQNKALFREFLQKHDFNVPRAMSYTSIEKALSEFKTEYLPVIVKPVDSAGSKGVSKVSRKEELKEAIQYALQFSTSEAFIVEEFLESKDFSSDTDCFSIEGELVFASYANQRFDANAPNPYTPSAYSWPSYISKENQEELTRELQRLIQLLQMKSSVYNVEVRETKAGKAYLMEVSPRGGGNRLSELLRFATGVDLIKRAVQAALGEPVAPISDWHYNGHWAEIILYSTKPGSFQELKIDKSVATNVKEVDLWVEKGETISAFNGANDAIGTLVLQFETARKLEKVLADYAKYVEVKVD